MKDSILKSLQIIWRRLIPHALKKRIIPYINQYYSEKIKRNVLKRVYQIGQTKNDTPIQSGPLIVSAFFSEPLGIGRAGHCSYDAFDGAGLNPIKHHIRPILNTHTPYQHRLPGNHPGGVHFIHCNPPEVLALIRALHPESYSSTYRIGYWAYELMQAPQDWIDVSYFFHEIWVPSEFVKSALSNAHCPIRVMPHDVLASLASLDLDFNPHSTTDDKFTIMTAGDLRSSVTRKNLEGSLNIYFEAFPKPSDNVKLIIKISATNSDEITFAKLKSLTDKRDDVQLIAEDLAYIDVLKLMMNCDLFLSPHRSEGFGLMLAEFLALGKGVLATGWSGNMEFMSTIPDALLPYKMIPVRDQANIYSEQDKQFWADVDINHAAKKLRALANQESCIDYQPAIEVLKKVSELWSHESMRIMPFTNWIAK